MPQSMSEWLVSNKAKISALPETARDAVLDLVFERGLEPKLKGSNLSPEELAEAKNLFKSRYLGMRAPGLSSTFGAREAEARPEDEKSSVPSKVFGSVAAGLMQGTANLTSAAGLVPNPVSKHFTETAEVYRNKKFERENPIVEGSLEVAGQTPLFMTAGGGARELGTKAVSTAAIGIRGTTKIIQALKNAVPFLSSMTADSLVFSRTPSELASPANLAVAAGGAALAGRQGAKAFASSASPSISRPLAGAGRAVEAVGDVKSLGTPSPAAEASRSFEPHSVPLTSGPPATPLKPVGEAVLESVKSSASPDEALAKIRNLVDGYEKVESSEKLAKPVAEAVVAPKPKTFNDPKARAGAIARARAAEKVQITPKGKSIEEMALAMAKADEVTLGTLPKIKNKIKSLKNDVRSLVDFDYDAVLDRGIPNARRQKLALEGKGVGGKRFRTPSEIAPMSTKHYQGKFFVVGAGDSLLNTYKTEGFEKAVLEAYEAGVGTKVIDQYGREWFLNTGQKIRPPQ